ncbi:hypothetical protein [Ectobacillus polymachus]|uniref:hypothetical protein n=1 Tax=Ectobacillus polymachus TaxID=1508806 RepID=UPI003A87CE4E
MNMHDTDDIAFNKAGLPVPKITALGLGGHLLLEFDANVCDEMYKLGAEEKTILIQIPIDYHQY